MLQAWDRREGGSMIMQWILNEQDGMERTGLISLRIRASGVMQTKTHLERPLICQLTSDIYNIPHILSGRKS
jgi:hypothetical protein